MILIIVHIDFNLKVDVHFAHLALLVNFSSWLTQKKITGLGFSSMLAIKSVKSGFLSLIVHPRVDLLSTN